MTEQKPHAGDANQTKQGFIALMSRMVIDDTLPLRFMYKTVPEHLNDTGWRIYTGYESEAFLANDMENMIPVTLDQLHRMDPTVEPLLKFNAGTVWERTPGNDWQRVHDFDIPRPNVQVDITNDIDKFSQKN